MSYQMQMSFEDQISMMLASANTFKGYYDFGVSYYLNRNYERSRQCFEAAIKLEPTSDYYQVFNYLGNIAFHLARDNNFTLAIQWFSKAIQKNGDYDAPYNSLGVIYKLMKNYNMAVKNFDKCISLNPKNPLAYYGLGNCLIELKNFPEAYKNLTKSAQLSETYDAPHNSLGNLYRIKGDLNKALEAYNKCLSINPNNQEAIKNIEYLKKEKLNMSNQSLQKSYGISTEQSSLNSLKVSQYRMKSNEAPIIRKSIYQEYENYPQQNEELFHSNFHKQDQKSNFLNNNSKNKQLEDIRKHKWQQNKNVKLEARDEELIFQFDQKLDEDYFMNDEQINKHLSRWLFRTTEKILSVSFRSYLSEEMTFNQTKIYICKNIMKNVFYLSSNASIKKKIDLNGTQFFDFLNKEFQNAFEILKEKYPLNQQLQIPYQLEKLIDSNKIDKINAYEYDYFHFYENKFTLRIDENYNDLIMEIINNVIEFSKSNTSDFKKFMTNLFNEGLQSKLQMEKFEKKKKEVQRLNSSQKLATSSNFQRQQIQPLQIDNSSNLAQQINTVPKRSEERNENGQRIDRNHKKEIEKIKSYTSFEIKSKIPESIKIYQQCELENKYVIPIKHKSILRILTKWCQELEQKYSDPYYYINNQKLFNMMNQNQAVYLSYEKRKQFNRNLKDEWQKIHKFKEESLEKMNFKMQYELFKLWNKSDEELERNCTLYSMKIVENMNYFIVQYLNKLIHGLLVAAKLTDNEQKENIFDFRQKSSINNLPNLLTFKLKDLMRCRFTSKELQSQYMLRYLLTTQKIQIIKVKNRLLDNTNDIMLNFFYKGKDQGCIGQIQLKVESKQSKFIKCSNDFNHFIYEIERTIFGSIAQLCNIWISHDQKTVQIYAKVHAKKQNKFRFPPQHNCPANLINQSNYCSLFICSLCNQTIYHNNYAVDHLSCKNCQAWNVCALCRLKEMPEEELVSRFMNGNKNIKVYRKFTKGQLFPNHSIFILKESNIRKQLKYVKITDVQNTYLVQEKNEQLMTDNIIKFYQKWEECKKNQEIIDKLLKKYLIFSLDCVLYDHEYFINQIRNYFRGLEFQELKNNCKSHLIVNQKELRYIYFEVIQENTDKTQQNRFKFNVDKNKLGEKLNILHLIVSNDDNKENARFNNRDRYLLEEMLTDLINRCTNLKKLQFNQYDYELQYFPMINFPGLKILKSIECRFKNIDSILKNKNLSDLQELAILMHFCGIKVSLPEQIRYFTKLIKLQLTNMNIQRIPDFIENLKCLKYLNLSKNNLKDLPQTFNQLLELEFLDLSSNQFTSFPKIVASSKKLRILKLNLCKIKIIDSKVQKLKSLTELYLLCCDIEQIQAQLYKLSNLKVLQMGSNKINSSNYLKGLHLGQRLTLFKNFNKSIEDVGIVTNLFPITHCTYVELRNMSCKTMTNSRLEFSNIQILKITQCGLLHFPILKHCKNLDQLSLKKNGISKICMQDIDKLINLKKLVLDENPLKQLSSTFEPLQNLESLSMKKCVLSIFPNLKNPKLKSLLMCDNLIVRIPQSFFQLCPNIQRLDLSNCNPKDEVLQLPDLFYKLQVLKQIDLSQCGLSKLPLSLSRCTKLEKINIRSNNIQDIPLSFSNLPNLKQLNLLYNNFRNLRSNRLVKFLINQNIEKPIDFLNELKSLQQYDISYEQSQQQRQIVKYILQKNEQKIHQEVIQKARTLANRFSFSEESIQQQLEKPFILEKIYLEAQHQVLSDLVKRTNNNEEEQKAIKTPNCIKNIFRNLHEEKLNILKQIQQKYYAMKVQIDNQESTMFKIKKQAFMFKCQSKYIFFYPQDYSHMIDEDEEVLEEREEELDIQGEIIGDEANSSQNQLSQQELQRQIGGGLPILQQAQLSSNPQLNQSQNSKEEGCMDHGGQQTAKKKKVYQNYRITKKELIEALQNQKESHPKVVQFISSLIDYSFMKKFDPTSTLKYQLTIYYFKNIFKIGFPLILTISCSAKQNLPRQHNEFRQWVETYQDVIKVQEQYNPKISLYQKYWESDQSDCHNQ